MQEVELGGVAGPFDEKPMSQWRSSPIGVIPKKDGNLSRDKNTLAKSGASSDTRRVPLKAIDSEVDRLIKLSVATNTRGAYELALRSLRQFQEEYQLDTCEQAITRKMTDLKSSDHEHEICRECCHGNMCNNKGCGDDAYRSCDDHFKVGRLKSGVYTISPDDVNTFDVYCDMENGDGGWIVLQRRFNGLVLFNRSFAEYENGFGELYGEFWIGLKKMHILAHSSRKVKFNLQALNGTWLPLEYNSFYISNASQQYTLHVSNHTNGFCAESFEYNNGKVFSTYDRDSRGCAASRFGGFWYNGCTYLNINGHFGLLNDESGVIEHRFYSGYVNFQKTIMMIQ
ncbi:microfibril-associated glycoprotein 4-like [Ylistrum balloti]|uniref:microfibril-associated glycoprotein 4-like n=1 Tax=Ylistrum balloti TaxID=509963 RepID=UPI002905BC86|nr:microfibril-associated glycoprotein 4-like [Ylistrum balloti]